MFCRCTLISKEDIQKLQKFHIFLCTFAELNSLILSIFTSNNLSNPGARITADACSCGHAHKPKITACHAPAEARVPSPGELINYFYDRPQPTLTTRLKSAALWLKGTVYREMVFRLNPSYIV